MTYSYCLLISASAVALLAMSGDFFVSYINNILIPCQHDSVWVNGRCMCENTGGVYAGTYCDVCQCEHLGICGIIQNRNSSSRYGCRCPSHQKWVGTLCDKCYAVEKTPETCRGDCLENHYGTNCDTVCLEDFRSTNGLCQEITSGGGTCNACNGHGTCSSSGTCQCEDGWFTSLGGEQCSMSCSDIGLTCPAESGTCRSIGGKMQCVCRENYFGRNCDQTCPGVKRPCSGHGTCEMDMSQKLVCTCDPHFTGEDCSIPCPGDSSYPTACSGHGQCIEENGIGICECSGVWESDDCSCSELFTCSGHGSCNADGSCQCYDESAPEEMHFDGAACERCKEHWFGQTCHLRCEASLRYTSSSNDGLNIGCNGHGSCSLVSENEVEHITCTCSGTDPDTFCATCMPNYYPDINLPSISVPACSVECGEQTCSYNGVCNEFYDGSNDLCNCTKWTSPDGLILDTLDPDRFCSTCRENWYPSDMADPNRCTYYCAADGELQTDSIIFFRESDTERNYELNGDENAQKVCSTTSVGGETFYRPDADCRVCSGSSSKCMADGSCKCSDGTTGQYCEIQCGSEDEPVCSGHGRCIRNDLDMWFDPFTNKYRCECIPYDTYTSETRQRLLKRGFQVEPPPDPEYYGRFCEFHCPRYNEKICTERGSCNTGVAVAESELILGDRYYKAGEPVFCQEDEDCRDIQGSFCARLSTPWDSLMSSGYSTKSFFSNGVDSPGYFTCATSQNCIDSIYSIEWDRFCVNMLNGWYPHVLNTAECVYNEDYQCRESVEDFFMNSYDGEDTWCQAVTKALTPPKGETGICGDESYADRDQFFNERVPICHEYTLEASCNSQPECIYDQTLNYIRATDELCATSDDCSGRCIPAGNSTCRTKTYCRAKTCSDIIFENNVEKLCLDVTQPCDSTKDWQKFCAESVGKIRTESSSLNSMETFYTCYMYKNSISPALPDDKVPGNIPIIGVLSVFGENVPVSEFRKSFVDSRASVPSICSTANYDSFCTSHLASIVPDWYQNDQPSEDWFLSHLLVCDDSPVELFRTDAEANLLKVQQELSGRACDVEYRISRVDVSSGFEGASSRADSIDYAGKQFTINCLNDILIDDDGLNVYELDVDQVDFTDQWSAFASGCTFKDNIKHQRWGGVRWTPAMVQEKYLDSCKSGNSAAWIDQLEPIPTINSLSICGSGIAMDCPECPPWTVKCQTETAFKCIKRNPCAYNAQCFKSANDRISREYYCDITPYQKLEAVVNGIPQTVSLGGHSLMLVDSEEILPNRGTVQVGDFVFNYTETGSPSGMQAIRVGIISNVTNTKPYIQTLDACSSDTNWFEFCSSKEVGYDLVTEPSFGLVNWTGNAGLLRDGLLKIHRVEYTSASQQNELEIKFESDSWLKVVLNTVDGNEKISYHNSNVLIQDTFDHCVLEALNGAVMVSSIRVSGLETVVPFELAMKDGQREFYFTDEFSSTDTQRSDYRDWSFDVSGHISVFRKNGTDLNDGSSSAHLIKGLRWPLQTEDNLRVSGWTKVPESSLEMANMRLLTSDYAQIAEISVYQSATVDPITKRVLLNGEPTDCRVSPHRWWYWQLDAEHHSEVERQTTLGGNTVTVFDQIWNIKLYVSGNLCKELQVVEIEASGLEKIHQSKIAESFHDVKDTTLDECRVKCHSHSNCRQYSHTEHDSHCYLHSKRCHEDSECVHGTHTLRAIHSQKLGYFEIYAESTGVKASWTRIRAEPLIEFPVNCSKVDIDRIDERWRSVFESQYNEWNPDATMICNGLSTSFSVMPGYESAVCMGRHCNKNNNLENCARTLTFENPGITSEDCSPLNGLNWTAYCRYKNSFDSIGGNIPILGLDHASMDEICTTSGQVYDEATESCPDISSDWFLNCFERTTQYEEFCSNDCLTHIESMLADNGPEDRGICEKRLAFLDIYTNASGDSNGLSQSCNCNIDSVILSDFCLIQDAYHDDDMINVPELYNSECSVGCMDTLKAAMNRSQWRSWCSDLSLGTIPGVCSKTVCDCDSEEYPGVSGPVCELNCPTGFAQGEELACSGRNGQCFAMEPSERTLDTDNQARASEVRNASLFAGADIPKWVRGPDPNLPGRCQCALGSGIACSIPCDQCNNGVYGPDVASQYGICDSYNGICRSLPTFMRYNSKIESDEYVSKDTTAFESSQGITRWEFPERFLYESDSSIFDAAKSYILDPRNSMSGVATLSPEIPLVQQNGIFNILKVWSMLCEPEQFDFEYLDNEKGVTNRGIELAGSRVLKTTQIEPWGRCQPIYITDDWYLCFENGFMHAYDNVDRHRGSGPGALIVVQTGDDIAPTNYVSFSMKDPETIFAFGGQREYATTSETFNHLYEIKVNRISWTPTDIVFVECKQISANGLTVPAGKNIPMHSYTNELFLAFSDGIYRLDLPTSVREGEWTKYDSILSSRPVSMAANQQRQLFIKYDDGSTYTFSPALANPWSSFVPNSVQWPDIYSTIAGKNDNRAIPCTVQVSNNSLTVSGIMVASFEQNATTVRIFLEEWSDIDPELDAAVILRVFNTILWRFAEPSLQRDLTDSEASLAVDMVERVYMHQARWSIVDIMTMKYLINESLPEPIVDILSMSIEPSEQFRQVFRSVSASYFAQTPATNPNKFTVSIEGPEFKRYIVVSANYDEQLSGYEQEIDMDTEIVVVKVDWSPSALRLQVKQKFGTGVFEWYAGRSYRTWHLVFHIEEWQFSDQSEFQSTLAPSAGPFQLYAMPESSSTYNMDKQISNFLQYTPSHCSLTADEKCPGTLPYINLPCSGHGKCNIACQCTCEVAKSFLQNNENALKQIDPLKSPWRGEGCEIQCPGYDGYNLESICSGRPESCQADGTCACPQGFTGDACQFECPRNEDGDVCSSHGGCGTQAYELSTFNFINERYMDTLTAMNRKRYSTSLSNFYGSCVEENYVSQPGSFGFYVKNSYPSFVKPFDAFYSCSVLNSELDIDLTQETLRVYPVGRCVGVRSTELGKYVPVVLRTPQEEFFSVKSLPLFECEAADCSIELYENDDRTIEGIRSELLSPSYEFFIDYVHGYSTGRTQYVVNNQLFVIDLDWSPSHLTMTVGSEVYGNDTIIDESGSFNRVKMVIEMNTLTVIKYPSWVPESSDTETVWIAPSYDVKYTEIKEPMNGYYFQIPSEDTGNPRTLMNIKSAEYDCDLEPDCLGLIRWISVNPSVESLYSLYTNIPNLNGWTTYELDSDSFEFTYLKKMSLVYQGRETVNSKCNIVSAGQAKYPTVSFTEDYNIPIKDLDIRLAQDEDTQAVIIGDGYWSKCWTRVESIHTKTACYQYALNNAMYGFAFSDDTALCMVYSGITDNTKIKLDRYNSESRLSLFDPCDEDASWFT